MNQLVQLATNGAYDRSMSWNLFYTDVIAVSVQCICFCLTFLSLVGRSTLLAHFLSIFPSLFCSPFPLSVHFFLYIHWSFPPSLPPFCSPLDLSVQYNERRRKRERPSRAWNGLSFYYDWQPLTTYCTSHCRGYPQQHCTNRTACWGKKQGGKENRSRQASVICMWGRC